MKKVRTRVLIRLVLLACVAAVTVEAQGAVNARRGEPKPSGNAKGVALLKHVAKRYRTVPGVKATFALPGLRLTGLLSLQSGVVIAEEIRFQGGPGEDISVARLGGPTYERAALKHCWKRVPRTGGLSFPWVGSQLISGFTHLQLPKPMPGGWVVGATLESTNQKLALAISTPSYLLRSITFHLLNGKRVIEHIEVLKAAPHLVIPRPIC